jgi:hypothetical protein
MTLPIELDHVVLFTHEDAPEAQALEALGLRGFGGITHHGDLGTASTSFFFVQHYLELFWIDDELAAQKSLSPLGFDLRARIAWRETAASPFGVMFRQRAGATGPIPFPTRQLRAEWMPGEIFVNFAAEVTAEPYYGVVPDELSYPSFKTNIAEPAHALGIQELTSVRITAKSEMLSPIARLLSTNGLITIERGGSPLMELTFDAGVQGKILDVRPTLPLVMAY